MRTMASRPMFIFFLLFLSLMLVVKHAAAQETDLPALPEDDNQPEPTPADDNSDENTEPTPANTDADPTEDQPEPTPAEETDANTDEPTAEPTPADEETTGDEATPTPEATETDDTEMPSLTTESASETDSGDFTLPTLPTLPGAVSIPTPAVPPKEGAPYLEKSNLPEGTVFIGVGAALGLIALVVIAWRVLVAWSINRSVRQSAADHSQSDATALLQRPKNRNGGGGGGRGNVYKDTPGMSMSMEKLGSSSARHSGLPPRNSHNPGSGLFFSPTAGASMHTSGNRGSGYLPAGYYAASGATAGAGGGAGQAQGSGSSIGLSPLGQGAQNYSRSGSIGQTPPGSPGLRASGREDNQGYTSTSSLNLSAAPRGRAPSAYLEDLFENHPPGR